MDAETYRKQILEGYRGELLAAAALREFRRGLDASEPRHDAIDLFEQLEITTAEVMLPLMQKYSIPMPDEQEVEAEGKAAGVSFKDWDTMMSQLRGFMPDVVISYNRLADEAEEGDEIILNYFAEHERALMRMAEADLEGEAARDAAIKAIEELIETRPR